MNDWSFARPLPPGAFPDEDLIAGTKTRDPRRAGPAKPAGQAPAAGRPAAASSDR